MLSDPPLRIEMEYSVEGVFKLELFGKGKDNHPTFMAGWTSLYIQCGRQSKILTMKNELKAQERFVKWKEILLAKLVLGEELDLQRVEAELEGRRY